MSIFRDRKHLRWGSGCGSGCFWGRGRRASLQNIGQSLSFQHNDGGVGWPARLSKDHRALRSGNRTETHVQRLQEVEVERQEHQTRRQEEAAVLPYRWPGAEQGLRIHDESGRPARGQ